MKNEVQDVKETVDMRGTIEELQKDIKDAVKIDLDTEAVKTAEPHEEEK